jgi:hypothetical protein
MKTYKPFLIRVTFLRKAYFDLGSIHCQDLLDKMERKISPANEGWGSEVCVAEMVIIVNRLIGLNNFDKYRVKWIHWIQALTHWTFCFYQKKNTLHYNCLLISLISPLGLKPFEESDCLLLVILTQSPAQGLVLEGHSLFFVSVLRTKDSSSRETHPLGNYKLYLNKAQVHPTQNHDIEGSLSIYLVVAIVGRIPAMPSKYWLLHTYRSHPILVCLCTSVSLSLIWK